MTQMGATKRSQRPSKLFDDFRNSSSLRESRCLSPRPKGQHLLRSNRLKVMRPRSASIQLRLLSCVQESLRHHSLPSRHDVAHSPAHHLVLQNHPDFLRMEFSRGTGQSLSRGAGFHLSLPFPARYRKGSVRDRIRCDSQAAQLARHQHGSALPSQTAQDRDGRQPRDDQSTTGGHGQRLPCPRGLRVHPGRRGLHVDPMGAEGQNRRRRIRLPF